MVPFLIYALAGGAIPLPLTALLILAIDLGTETLPALALKREPAEPGIMRRLPRRREERLLDRPMLLRAWVWLGLLEAALVTAAFFWLLTRAGWSPGDPTGSGTKLNHAYLQAITITFAGITACQVGTAFATRTNRAALRMIGVFSNRMLLWGIAFEVAFAASIIYLPPLPSLFGTASLSVLDLAPLAVFPILVWGRDELRRWAIRRSTRIVRPHPTAAAENSPTQGERPPRRPSPVGEALSRRPSVNPNGPTQERRLHQ